MNKRKELARHLQSNFNFDLDFTSENLDSNSAFIERLKAALAERIKFMINVDMDKLLQALYRIDVNDRETDRAFALGEINEVSLKLADLIIRRQLQKLDYSREFYRNHQNDDEF